MILLLLMLLHAVVLLKYCGEGFQFHHQTTHRVMNSNDNGNNRHRVVTDNDNNDHHRSEQQRRKFLTTAVGSFVAGSLTGIFSFRQSATAIPMASVDEFDTILRDAPLSIEIVEFSGPKGETIIVKLIDGTKFGIKDIVESTTDPRSPLKVQAACREFGVKTKSVDLENMLAGLNTKKKKLYTNERVQKAAEKERAKNERMRLDEEERLAELAKLKQQEEAQYAAAEANTNTAQQ